MAVSGLQVVRLAVTLSTATPMRETRRRTQRLSARLLSEVLAEDLRVEGTVLAVAVVVPVVLVGTAGNLNKPVFQIHISILIPVKQFKIHFGTVGMGKIAGRIT